MDDVTRSYGCTHSSPIHQLTKYLRFIGGDRFYQFTALPFSIATVPLEFLWWERGETDGSRISIHQYTGKWLMSQSNLKQQCQVNTDRLVHLVERLGWIIIFKKIRFSSNSRNQIFGYKFDLRLGLVFPIQKKSIVFSKRLLLC